MYISMELGDLVITSLAPTGVPAKYAHLVPERAAQHVKFDMRGVMSSVPNAIRRTIMSELNIVGLYGENIETNDKHLTHIIDMIYQRVKMIPVDQDLALTAKYVIDVTNKTPRALDITCADMKQVVGGRKTLPCNSQIVIVTLQPNRHFRMTLRVDQRFGNAVGDGGRTVAARCSSVELDRTLAKNTYDGTGESISMRFPMDWTVSFVTHGTAPPGAIIAGACDNIITRLRRAREAVEKGETIGDEYRVRIDDSPTIGKLIAQQVFTSQICVNFIAPDYNQKENYVTLRLKTSNDPTETIAGAIDSLIGTFHEIEKKYTP